MTPKAQQLGVYDVPATTTTNSAESSDQKEAKLQRNSPDILAKISSNTNNTASLIMSRVTSVISPTVVFLVATPIALRYPLIQFIMFLTILVGTSPLYFIMITFVGKNNKHKSQLQTPPQHQSHRRVPSIVGKIDDLKDNSSEGNTVISNNNNNININNKTTQ